MPEVVTVLMPRRRFHRLLRCSRLARAKAARHAESWPESVILRSLPLPVFLVMTPLTTYARRRPSARLPSI